MTLRDGLYRTWKGCANAVIVCIVYLYATSVFVYQTVRYDICDLFKIKK